MGCPVHSRNKLLVAWVGKLCTRLKIFVGEVLRQRSDLLCAVNMV